MRSVALVTDEASLPIDYDMPLLLDACHASGLAPEICDWEDATVDWSRFDIVLLRSPWTYVNRLPAFLGWCERVTAVTHLCNPLSVVRWSLEKRYLADLSAQGVPVVQTEFLGPDAEPHAAVRKAFTALPESAEIVVKPTVGAYSKDVQRFGRAREGAAAEHAARLLKNGLHVMLQPYVNSVDRDGETNLIYFDGVYSHAIRKSAMLMPDGTVNVPTFESRTARDAEEDERAVATAALDAAASHLGLEQPLVYGRIDVIRGDDRKPMVLELELCEPSLNLPFAEGGAQRFARALESRLARSCSA